MTSLSPGRRDSLALAVQIGAIARQERAQSAQNCRRWRDWHPLRVTARSKLPQTKWTGRALPAERRKDPVGLREYAPGPLYILVLQNAGWGKLKSYTARH
jgi:hypothetical protein